MRRYALVAPMTVGLAVTLMACGGSNTADSAAQSSSAVAPSQALTQEAPTQEAPDVSASTPAPDGSATFVTLIEAALAPYAGLLGQPVIDADISGALPSVDGDVPRPTGGIVGVARTVATWGDTLESTQILGLDTGLSRDELESYGASAPPGWMYNSISSTDSGMTLVMTRDDGTRVAYVSSADPGDGAPSAEFRVESNVAEMPQPAWLAALPVPEGGDLTLVAEGVGDVEVEFTRAAGGLATATWRFPSQDLEAILAFYSSGVLEQGGFTLVDPESIVVGASEFDVTTGPWIGSIVVGELIQDEESFTAVQWLLMRP